MCRLENLPTATALKRMMAAMVDLFCDSFDDVPRRIVLDIDDTEDRVHGQQQLSLFHAHYDSRCFLPIHIYEAGSGKPVAVILRPGKTPDGAEVARVLRQVVRAIRARWPRIEILIRGDSHYSRPEALDWLERNRVGHIFGLGGNAVLLARVRPLAEDAAMARVEDEDGKVRRYGEFPYAARTWMVERRVIARVEASAQGSDSRFVVTNLKGAPRWLYEDVYCARGQAENLIKAHKLHLASDRSTAALSIMLQGHSQPVPPAGSHRRLLAPSQPARLGTQGLVLARRPVRHAAPSLRQDRRAGHRAGHPHQGGPAVQLSLPGQPDAADRPRRQAAALTAGAACPIPSPSPATPNSAFSALLAPPTSATPANPKPTETKGP